MRTKLQILSLILIIGLIFNANIFAQSYSGGSGTGSDPYQIYTKNDLYNLTTTTSDWDKHFIQMADLDFTGTASVTPIGSSTTPFSGSYNGQGHTITSLTVSATNNVGLFGYINEAIIRNVGLINVTIAGETSVGGLVGSASSSSLIEDCYATGSVTGSNGSGTSKDIGGLVGAVVSSNVNVKNCYSECNVSFDGEHGIGGFVGRSSGIISNCYSTGSVSDNGSAKIYSYWGGFIGYNNGAISNCFATGDVAGSGTSVSRAGGFVGYNYGGNIELCYATGNISSASEVGGFVGNNFTSSSATSIIVRSYSSGNVSSNANVGGFIGRLNNAELKNCYSLGDVTKTGSGASYGGFCGDIVDEASIEHCYSTGAVTESSAPTDKGFVGSEISFTGSYNLNFFNTTTSNQVTATGATGKNHDGMNDEQTYTDGIVAPETPWDIIGVQGAGTNNYWEMVSSINSGYPFIRAEYSSPTNTVTVITENSATCGGNVFDSGSRDVTERGVCWSTSSSPTTADSKTSDGTTTGAFTSSITGLSALTKYYVRAYVTNNVGTSYGDEETFTTTAATPVELTQFTANASAEGVVLNWTTATEVNNYGFEVERASIRSQERNYSATDEWETIGFVEGHGNSNSPNEYSFVDTDKLSGTVSYRLKQLDVDGAFEYHDVVSVKLNGTMEYKLAQNSPNPFNPSTQISFTIPEAGVVKLNVYNMLGEKVTELVNKNLEAGSHQYNFDASNLSSGIYFYSISINGFTEVKKMNLIK